MQYKYIFISILLFFLNSKLALSQSDISGENSVLISTGKIIIESESQDQTSDTAGRRFSDVLDSKKRYFHPFFSIVANYTDNVYRTQDDQISDSFIFTAPGFWLAYPPSRDQVVRLTTSGSAAGGLSRGVERTESEHRFQSYLYYAVDVLKYDKESELDGQNQTLEGMLKLGLKGGLGIELIGQFKENSQFADIVSSSISREYNSYLYELSMYYQITENFHIRSSYRNFTIDMINEEDDDLDRLDEAYMLNIGWGISENTQLTFNYNQVHIKYTNDDDTQLQVSGGNISEDSVSTTERGITEYQFDAGIDWEASEKISTGLTLGMTERKSDSPGNSNSKTTTVNFSVNYSFSDKVTIIAAADKGITEPESPEYSYIVVQSWDLSYEHRLNQKLSATFSHGETKNEFFGLSGDTVRIDKTSEYEVVISYVFSDWLEFESGFNSQKNISDDEIYNVAVNSYYLGISGDF